MTMTPASGPPAPAGSIAEVIQKMQEMQSLLPDTDGLKWFNFLYLAVTQAMQTAIATAGTFEDSGWIDRLDVVFANLYFAAVSAAQQQGVEAAPAAWRPLLGNRATHNIARIQFALAGMNAHINRDLVVALLAMYASEGQAPDASSPQFRDFMRVNQLLQGVEAAVKPALLVGTPLETGGHLAPLEDILAMWSVSAARQSAWDHSQALWNLRGLPPVQQASLDALDGLTELASNGLLVRVLP
jgi:hypothetical protein